MRSNSRPRRLFVQVVVTSLAGAVAAVLSSPATATASAGDKVAPVTDTGSGYAQSFARADGTVGATYTLAGSRLDQDDTSTATMNSRGTSVVFSPTGVLNSTGASIDNTFQTTASCAGGSGTATDCGASGTIKIDFDRPVTNPTLHVSGLGGNEQLLNGTYANFATYFNLSASASSTAAANSATLSTLQGTPTNLQLTAGGRVQTTGLRPGTSCDSSGSNGSTSVAGCGSVLVSGTNLTSITLSLGMRNSGSGVDPVQSAVTGPVQDNFLFDVSIPDVTAPGTAFECSTNAVYGIDGADFNVNRIDTNTGVETFIGHVNAASGSSLNGLAITDGGAAAYTMNRNVTAGGSSVVYRLNPVTGATSTYAGPTLTQTKSGTAITHGAVNPANGIYYFGIIGGDGLEIYGFNTSTNTAVTGRIAHIPSITGGNGDLAFDRLGRLVFIASSGNGSATANPLLYVNAPLPSTGNDATLATSVVGYMQPNNSTFNGLAFDLPQGYLYVNSSTSGQSTLRQLNPTSGAEIANHPITYLGQATNDVTDLGSCSYNNSIQLQTNVVSRAAAGDQFTATITGGGLAVAQTGTTSGTSTGVQTGAAATAGAFPALAGAQYTITETAANAGTDLSRYFVSWRCVNLLDPGTTVLSGSGRTGTVPFPTPTSSDGIPLGCYFTNEAIASGVSISKTADRSAYHVGDTVTYTIKVTNTGNSTLTSVAVTDPTDAACARTIGTLAAAAVSTYTCTDTAPVTGNANTATVTGNDPLNAQYSASSTANVTTIRPALSVTKTASPTTVTAAGQSVTYSFGVTNTGDATLTNLAIADTPVAPGGVPASISCPTTTLAAGASTTCTGTYAVTQADIDNGTVKDSAVANAKDQVGSTVTSNSAQATVTATQNAVLTLTKTASPTTIGSAGATVSYAFVVRNDGNVTITNIALSDVFANSGTLVPTISCPGTSLAPAASMRCTATYTATQADIDQGSIANTATATGKNPSAATVTSNQSSATVTAVPAPGLSLTMSADPITVTAAGQTVTYSFVVANTGNQTLSNIAVADTFTAPAGPAPTVSCPGTPLAPGTSTTCTASYVVTVADMNKGSIRASAVAQSTDPRGAAVNSAQANLTVTATQRPALTVAKSADPTTITGAQQITYSFLVRNTGNVTVDNLAVADSLAPPATPEITPSCPDTSLAPGSSTTCSATYTPKQADLDNGTIKNSATASGTDPTGTAVTSPASAVTVTVTRSSTLTLVQSASPTSVNAVNQSVTYSFLVTNTGNQTVTGLAIDDTLTAPAGPPLTITCPSTTLAPTASTTCTATYKTLQADLDKGTIGNTAKATGKDPTNSSVASNTSVTSVTATQSATLTLTKSASPTTVATVGQTVNYSFLVANSGNVTVSTVAISDPMFTGAAAPTCPSTTLAPGASTTCSATYSTTQADLDAGRIRNTATATGSDPKGNAVASAASTATVTVSQTASLVLAKSASPASVTTAGNTVSYRFAVRNSGNVTITTLGITDTFTAPAGPALSVSCPTTPLAPNATATCTSTYTATQADINAGSVSNSAVATGRNPANSTVTSNTSTATVTTSRTSSLSLVKSADPTSVTAAGTTVTYTFAVTNSGNTTVSGIGITDTFAAPAGPPLTNITCAPSALQPGAGSTCSATYTVTQADVDHGDVRNSAVATGTDTSNATITSNTSSATVTIPGSASLGITAAASPTSVTAAGQRVNYTFVVTNTGNVTLTNPAVTDTFAAPAGPEITPTCPTGAIAPNASITCTAAYTATQADIDNGSIKNAAVASARNPSGNSVSSTPARVTVNAPQSPAMTMVKAADPSGVSAAGARIDYTFTVTNTGNVTLSLLHITDTLTAPAGPTPSVSCPSTTIAPAAVVVCTASYTVTQADQDAGSVGNSAVAEANDPSGNPVRSPRSTSSVSATRSGALSLVKSAAPSTVAAAGAAITYTFTVKNTGNVTVSGLSVADRFSAPAGPPLSPINCSATSLAPNASATCTASYTATQADVNNGSIENSAVASGTDPGGAAVTSNRSSATVTTTSTPALTLTNVASPATITAAGQTVTYAFTVKNTGNIVVNGVAVNDPLLASPPTCDASVLAPGASTDCTGTYQVTQADADNGSFVNAATAGGTTPTGTAVTSPAARSTVTVTQQAVLSVSNSPSRDAVTAAGQAITYTFGVTNSGNVTVHGISITNRFTAPAGPPLSPITCADTSLAPGRSTTCSATYTVQQADIDNGSIVNGATAGGLDPNNTAVGSDQQNATVTATRSPALSVVQTADPTSATRAGQTVTYSFAVTNSGNVTVTDLAIDDALSAPAGPPLAVNCPATTLAPTGSTTCTAAYRITQDDVDAGSVANSATATGRVPAGDGVTSAESATTVTIAPGAALTVTGSASPAGYDAAGTALTFTYTVTNTGTVTVSGVAVDDARFPGAGAPACQTGTLAPGASTTCTATYTTTQADVDNGSITDSAAASGTTPKGAQVGSAPVTTTATAGRRPVLRLLATATPDNVETVGQSITYRFAVTNAGNVTVQNLSVATVFAAPADSSASVSCPDTTTLAPGASTNCLVSYVTTQDDFDHGSVDTTAAAHAETSSGQGLDSNPSSVSVSTVQSPGLTVTSSADPSEVNRVDQTVTYTFVVRNTGTVSVHDLSLLTTLAAPAGTTTTPVCGTGVLDAGDSTTCTATYSVTRDDLDHGSIAASTVARALDPQGDPVTSPRSTATVTADQAAALTLTKSATPAGVTTVGQSIQYSFAIANTGNVTVTDLHVDDPMLTGAAAASCPGSTGQTGPSLAAGSSLTCTATYAATQADLDRGTIHNTATAAGDTPAGGTVTSPASSATVAAQQGPAISVTTSVSAAQPVDRVGRTVTVTVTVENTGTTTLTGVAVSDRLAAPAGPPLTFDCPSDTTLAPHRTFVCTAVYTATQADLDAGSISDSATASGRTPGGSTLTSAPSTAAVATTQSPALTVAATVDPTTAAVDDRVTYSFLVTNTGNVTVNAVTIRDTVTAPATPVPTITCPASTLAPGGTTTCTGSYLIKQADGDAGSVVNTASATGTAPGNRTVSSDPSTSRVTVPRSGALSLVQSASPDTVTAVGQTVAYTFKVTNTGNVTVRSLSIADTLTAPAGPALAITCPTTTVAPTASTTCTGTYTVTQDDLDHGTIGNRATASGADPASTPVTSNESATTVTAAQSAGLSLVASATPRTVTGARQSVTYTFRVTNNGTVTIDDLSIASTFTAQAGPMSAIRCTDLSLAPTASTTCIGTYVTTQDDLDLGTIRNSAVANAADPQGGAVASNASATIVTATQTPAITLVKSADPTTVGAAADTVDYTFTVANTGNVRVHDVDVADTLSAPAGPALDVACPDDVLDPHGTLECTATYSVTQADVDNGVIDNSATASAASPAGPVTSGASTATVTARKVRSLTLTASAAPATATTAGQNVTFSFVVKNTGNRTISNVGVDATLTAPAGPALSVSCPQPVLAPGRSTTCTAVYRVTQADVDHGRIDSSGVASGTDTSGDPVTSAARSATVTITRTSTLSLVKSASVTSVTTIGRAVTYSFLVTNTGNTTIDELSVTDVFTAAAGPEITPSCPRTSLLPATSTTCTASYLVSRADLDRGSIQNTATAHGYGPTGARINSPASSATITATQQPSMTVVTSAAVGDRDSDGRTEVGDTVTWTFAVTNTGNVTLSAVTVSDRPAGTVTCPSRTLAAGASMTCRAAPHTVTQADVDNGSVDTSATATATAPDRRTVSAGPSSTSTPTYSMPRLRLVASAAPTTITAVGQPIAYTWLLTNTGTVTLTHLALDDTLTAPAGPAITPKCPSATLAVGATMRCTASYPSTRADFDAGSVADSATATATAPSGTAVTAGPSTTTVSTTQRAALAVVPQAIATDLNGNGYPDQDDTIRWTYVVTNTGTVTVTDVAVDAGDVGPVTCPSAPLPAGQSVTCTADVPHVVTDDDVAARTVRSVATATATSPYTGNSTVTSPQSSGSIPVGPTPALRVVVTGALIDVNDNGVGDSGDRIVWTFVVTNTGNVALTGIAVTDPNAGTVTCRDTSLAPGRSTTCTGSETHPVTGADVADGSVSTTAAARGIAPTGESVQARPTTATVPIPARSALTLRNSAQITDRNGDGTTGPGDTVLWLYRVHNTGNTTLTGVRIVDPATAPIRCPRTTLAPGASMTCVAAAHTVTGSEAVRGRLTDTATAAGRKPSGAVVTSPSATANVRIQAPSGNLGVNGGRGSSGGGDSPVAVDDGGSGSGAALADTGPQQLPALVWLGVMTLLAGLLILMIGAGPRRRRTAGYLPRHRSEGSRS